MSGMLGRAPANVPALVTRAEVFVSADGSKRFCKGWPRGADLVVEPTSVLDIRSPSPSSTLSSSVAASSESGVQGSSTESGGAVAVSGRVYEGTSSEGQLLDCTSLLEGGNEAGSLWGLETGEDGGAGHGMVGTWQASSDDMHRGWERNVAVQEGACKQHVDGPPGLTKEVVPGYLPGGNVGAPINPGFMQMLSMSQEKQGSLEGKEGLHKAERFQSMPSGRAAGPPGDAVEKTAVKREAAGDGSLEACVMSCRKREREDSLGEVVQRLCVGGQKIEAGEWLSDWNEFGENATADSVAEEKVPPGQLEDLDDIFSGSPPPPPSVEFWLGENLPSVQQQVPNYASNEAPRADILSHGDSQSSGKGQLDLFEAVQAGLLFRGGGNGRGSGGFASSVTSSPRPANISPSIQVLPRSISAPFTSLNQPFSPGGSPLGRPFQRHSFGDSALPAAAFLPEFLDSKPPLPANPLLNATFAAAPPHFSSQLPFHELAFPLPASFKKAAPPPANLFGFPRPEYHPPKAAEFADPKPWQMRMLEGDAPPKVIAGGPKWQLKPEPGWQPVEQFGAGHARGPHLSPHLPMPAEHAPRRQAVMPERVGRCVRLEELSLAERLLCAASEAAQLGDLSSAQAILARLNQQSSPKGQQQQQLPAQRVILLFAEALTKWVAAASSSPTPCPFPQQSLPSNSPLDLINKISAYKKFCEVSPISQFAHFTANQAILDAMEGEDCVHLIDLDLGFGGQWASFMQEISQRGRGPPELKITTMGADTLEMRLAKENLLQFAKEVGMKLEVNVVPVQKLEGMKAVMASKGEREAVAVNFGFGMNRLMSEFSSTEEVLGCLQMVKGLCPKVVAVVDSECEFEGPSGYIEALQFYSCVFESLEASTKLSAEAVHNIEGLVFGPKMADLVNARRLHKNSSESGLLPWRILLQKVGFTAFPFSSAAESQASWLVKNPLNTGFTFHKQHTTLLLGWYNKTLLSASAWV